MHYFLIAGEASGDLHAAALIRALRQSDPEARFSFLGGDLMAEAAGCEPIIHYRSMAYMGFVEVIRHLPQVLGNLRKARRALLDAHPDCFIPVDYPSFNLKVAKTAAKAGIPVYYFISPKIWAWKQWRVRTIRRIVDKVLCILPFEPKWYADHGYDRAVYVGNPSVEELDAAIAAAPDRETFCRTHRLRSNRQLLALLPGSRRGEIRDNLPIMNEVARRFPQYTIAVAAAPGIDDEFYSPLTRFTLVRNDTHALLRHAHAAIVTSGTATLEAALANTPQVVTYRSSGSKIFYNIMKRVLKVSHVTLPNLIENRTIIPEMLMHLCTPDAVAAELAAITPDDAPARAAQLAGYTSMRATLTTAHAAEAAAAQILSSLPTHRP